MVYAMRLRRDHNWKTTHFLRRREKGRERGMGDVARRRRLVDLLDLRALVGGLLGGRAAAHAAHVGHAAGPVFIEK